MRMQQLSIIIPIYHEEENILHALKGIQTHVLTPHTIFLVYDDPNDPTLPILKKHNKKNIQLVKNSFGKGIVAALKTGFTKAKTEILVIMMADLSDNPKDIDKMVKKINQGYDLVCAARYTKKGKRSGGPIIKGMLSYIACKTLRFFTGIPTDDATNAFKCFRKSILKDIKIESVGGFELPLEITVKAFCNGKKITEVPTIWHERHSGESKFKLIQWLPHYLRWYVYPFFHEKCVQ